MESSISGNFTGNSHHMFIVFYKTLETILRFEPVPHYTPIIGAIVAEARLL